MENSMEVSQKIKSTITWSSHSTSGYTLPKNLKQGVVEIFVQSYAIPALFTIAKSWMQSKCLSMNKWIYKTWHWHAMEEYSALKRNSDTCHNLAETCRLIYLQTSLIFKLQNDLGFFFFNWRKICLNIEKKNTAECLRLNRIKWELALLIPCIIQVLDSVPCW